MSIPKEPRQLMINLMYLVLTAMLALNVSAEIINAFFSLNKGIVASTGIVANSNQNIKRGIDKVADAYKNSINEGFRSKAAKAQEISADFEKYIKGITDELIEAAGGVDSHYSDGRPKKYKDKDITTNLFLSEGGGKGRGAEVEAKIQATRAAFLGLIDDAKDKAEFEKQIALMVEAVPTDATAKTWVELKFKQMPVAAVMPALSKLTNDAKTSETSLLNYFLGKVNGEETIRFDKFKVAIAPKKAYLIRGEKFEADVYLAAFSSNPGTNVSISVNGQGLSLNEGVGRYETTTSDLGEKTVKAVASIRNPLTGTSTSAEGEFKYEVGEKSVTVSAEKMNVFYIGVENPLGISAAGFSSNDITVSCSGCDVRKGGNSGYVVTASRAGEATINITARGQSVGSKKFRVKPIPNPSPQLPVQGPFNRGGVIPSGIIRAQSALMAVLDNFDFDARCSIQSFSVVKVRRNEDPQQANNNGGDFSADTRRIVGTANAGDNINFMQILGRCPGDQAARQLGSMSFFVR